MDVSSSASSIANSLNTVSTSREIPHEFRYHAKVLNDHLADVLRSGLFDDIDHFFKSVKFFGTHENSVNALISGEVDAVAAHCDGIRTWARGGKQVLLA